LHDAWPERTQTARGGGNIEKVLKMQNVSRHAPVRAATVVAFIGLSFALPSASHGDLAGMQRVATGLSAPMFVTHAPGDRTRLFIGERGGTIRVLNLTSGMLEPDPFLSIPSVDQAGEGGLLGMTFHPDYQTNGKFYVNVTIDNGGLEIEGATSPFSNYIRQYTVSENPNIANPTFTPIIDYVQPQNNHNAGWIGFSPVNGYLYIPTGDGGGANDFSPDGGHTPGTGNAQDFTNNLLGKILRIDVNGDDFLGNTERNYRVVDSNPYADVRDPDTRAVITSVEGDDEIWAIGLRNPFRDSFDRLTGDLWLGDVGQGSREEVDRQPFDASGADNFGWKYHEGFVASSTLENYRNPVYDYGRGGGTFEGSVVIGGYVYRGPDPDLQGKYIFGDNNNTTSAAASRYWMFDPANPYGTVQDIKPMLTPDVGSPGFPVAFGEDAVGNLYIAFLTGSVYRIQTDNLLAGDFDADGDVDGADFLAWKTAYGDSGGPADGNGDGTVNAADYTVWRNNLGASVHNPGSGASDNGANAPEPGALLLSTQLAALVALLFRRRRGRL
jgi:glucose/arabinose dehydrogenase